jgi:predicted nuclease with TOPRIM domain
VNPSLQQFLSFALPIMVTLVATVWTAQWSQNKRLDDLSKRLDEVIRRLERIESKLETHEERITRVEERTSPLRR